MAWYLSTYSTLVDRASNPTRSRVFWKLSHCAQSLLTRRREWSRGEERFHPVPFRFVPKSPTQIEIDLKLTTRDGEEEEESETKWRTITPRFAEGQIKSSSIALLLQMMEKKVDR